MELKAGISLQTKAGTFTDASGVLNILAMSRRS